MEEKAVGCAKPTGSVVGEKTAKEQPKEMISEQKEVVMSVAKVGQKAPDFQAPAFYKGKFVGLKLSDYLGKWIVLCFYPGDFTFV